ncbi:hypothetical protein BMS77_02145 [Leuconostoc pseudomesenteroides]|uniref:Uncharacterized protein n=1 Tax=Leuconostoc pseudomesenteroides TaxID=33968 RepID=A0A1X0VEB9_LEUPS|nr:hypothetical protein [Leuconostoc pseudomesenteroides]OQJ73342.1 hypothetical protein BMS77_02145 [Leuconostoc pseudomesenteroides]OQJ77544.1 hypothetical protein BMS83_01905 [Leuconostoc pseudomesenteroides]OQJ78199.1 hypothetical protein BMS82_03885 [Leuconostoc pseudomesenteroides]ORI37615.1 hypothetical protein BMR88_03680 [Leuconostoc pseudomesenteroides]ORI46002.1 hypothetical protein BMR94_04155 [Leuconostoc pseudomesenteroides]
MTRYIERLNRVYAIQNKQDYVGEIIPFLREYGIHFEYKENFPEGRHIDVNVNGVLVTFNFGEYLVVGSAGTRIMSSKEFVREFEEDIDLHKRIADLEAKLSKAMTDIKALSDKLPKQHENGISSGLFKVNEVGKVINV